MKFDDMNSACTDAYEKLVKMPTSENCIVCGTPTGWFQSLNSTYLCSEECDAKAIAAAFARKLFENTPASDKVAALMSEYTRNTIEGGKRNKEEEHT